MHNKIAAAIVILVMSLYRYFRPATGSSTSQDASFSAAAKAVEAAEKESIDIARHGKKRKSSERHHYDDETRTAIGKHAIKYGNKSAVEKYSRSLGLTCLKPQSETSSVNWKNRSRVARDMMKLELVSRREDVIFFF